MKLAISAEGPNPTDPVGLRFGRARYFLVFDTESEQFTAIDNAEFEPLVREAQLACRSLVEFAPRCEAARIISGIWKQIEYRQQIGI